MVSRKYWPKKYIIHNRWCFFNLFSSFQMELPSWSIDSIISISALPVKSFTDILMLIKKKKLNFPNKLKNLYPIFITKFLLAFYLSTTPTSNSLQSSINFDYQASQASPCMWNAHPLLAIFPSKLNLSVSPPEGFSEKLSLSSLTFVNLYFFFSFILYLVRVLQRNRTSW